MNTSTYVYHVNDEEHYGFLAYENVIDTPRPAVLVAPDWSGSNDFSKSKAEQLAKLGYIAFVVDMYGLGRTGNTNEEKAALMDPLINDRRLIRTRMRAAFDAVIGLEEVDFSRICAIGFCFGGLCALDLARSGADLKGVVSFHGLLHKPDGLKNHAIVSKILLLHGYDDPMVDVNQVQAFGAEMTDAYVDWQIHMYGGTMHAFTNPQANDPDFGTVYNPLADKRSWASMTTFLQEVFY